MWLQVGSDAALVPQQAAVAQFDGGNQLGTTFALRLVPETHEHQLISDAISRTCLCDTQVPERMLDGVPLSSLGWAGPS